ncbi:MAG: DUF4142 domain-containing protein [Bdellovibrionaceae bacterium]|nr:DUF4142 domain-containing protein [Pseudobdellovibrionaceae bacterium]
MKTVVFYFIAVTLALTARAYAAPAANLTDAEIAKAMVTINEGEIDAAKIAKDKTKNKEIESFAKMMIDDHKNNEKETKAIAKNHKLEMKDTDFSRGLKNEAKTSNKDLKKTEKTSFDSAYVAQQIKMHETALSTIDNTFLPQAKNGDLKNHLQKTREAVASHLEHAKRLQSSLQ